LRSGSAFVSNVGIYEKLIEQARSNGRVGITVKGILSRLTKQHIDVRIGKSTPHLPNTNKSFFLGLTGGLNKKMQFQHAL